MKNDNELIGSVQAAKLLGIERTTLYQWTSKKLIPFVRVSRNLIKFDRAELQSWIAESESAGIMTPGSAVLATPLSAGFASCSFSLCSSTPFCVSVGSHLTTI